MLNHYYFSVIVFNCPSNEKLYIRLRNEGSKKTFTIKDKSNNDKFFSEHEIIISDINVANKMLLLLGCTEKYKIEKLRECFDFDNVQIVFDYYPGLRPQFEIEAKDEITLNNFCTKFNLDPKDNVDYDIYASEYGLDPNRKIVGDLTFNGANDKFLNIITKNKSKFIKILKRQFDYMNKNTII